YEELPAILTAQEARAAETYVIPPLQLARGDAAARLAVAPHRESGEMLLGGQEQFYLEGQIAYAVPKDDDGMHVYCSTQHPSEMQHLVAHVLGVASP
ncbi:molybdopterin-dependent oxidoreductase, partial [Clostridioides difficile]|nr:molybdopterin-dependent oxidoreductase [Clostridioides difficile]